MAHRQNICLLVFYLNPHCFLHRHLFCFQVAQDDSSPAPPGSISPEPVSFFTLLAGGMCPFRHISGEKTVVCKHWLRGLCKKGDQCEFLHEYDMTKMPECYFYSKFGKAHGTLGDFADSQAPGPSTSLSLSSLWYWAESGGLSCFFSPGLLPLCNNITSLWCFRVCSTLGC